MQRSSARMLLGLLLWLSATAGARATPPAHAPVYLLGKLSDVDTIAATTALGVIEPDALVLFESERFDASLQAFLKAWQPRVLHSVNSLADIWPKLFPKAPRVVVCAAEPRARLLQAACLAGFLQAPLVVVEDKNPELRGRLQRWETKEVYAVGEVKSFWEGLGMRVVRLKNEVAVRDSCLRHAVKKGRIAALVVANPFDDAAGKGGMSSLAPWITHQKHGILLLTNEAGDNVKSLAAEALGRPELKAVESLVLVGNLKALPMERRANPLAGKDAVIETEPLTPAGAEPVSFATGRLFHEDPAIVALLLARPHLWRVQPEASHNALVVSNPGGGLPLLESFSRTTARELSNAGFEVTHFFNHDANRPDVRAALPKQTLFLWEGHHSTLIRDYEVHHWQEPLWPSLIFLQSCLALEGPKALPFLERGAVAVLGSSSRNFSGSGGALSLSYFDALVYDQHSLGASLRHAKNFLICFALLKEKRLGGDTRFTGANLRTALAFTLWGDPTLHVPVPPAPEASLTPITHHLQGANLTIELPAQTLAKVETAGYQAQVLPDARLAGLVSRADGQATALVPLIFREVAFTKAPSGKSPRLHSRLPDSCWVFLYDARRCTGYLLIRPHTMTAGAIRFTVTWEQE